MGTIEKNLRKLHLINKVYIFLIRITSRVDLAMEMEICKQQSETEVSHL